MKKIVLFLFLVIMVFACTSKTNNPKNSDISTNNEYDISQLLDVAFENIDKEVKVKGLVTHVCSHSGRRCFIEDSTGEHSIKIEATDTLGTFGRELMGTEIAVTGLLKEERLTSEYIDEWEIEIKKKHAHDAEEGGEKCASELANIKSMREWMKEHDKDYYSIFYIDGISYEAIE